MIKKTVITFFLIIALIGIVQFEALRTVSERTYTEIRTDYLNQGNIDEKFGFVTGLNKLDFVTFFTNSSFIYDILVPIGNCAGGGNAQADSERCQALLVAMIRKCGEQALSYYPYYAQLMGLINRPYQMIRVFRDMYSDDPKKIAKALHQLVIANPSLALINFNGDAVDFGMMQYVLLKYSTSILKNPMDQTWLPLLQVTVASWQKSADTLMRSKIIDFSEPDIIALAQYDDFELARVKAINPSALLTTESLAVKLGIKI